MRIQSNKRLFITCIVILFSLYLPPTIAQQGVLVDKINLAIQSVQSNTDLSTEQKQQATTELEEAQQMLAMAKEQLTIASSYEAQAASASTDIIAIQNNVEQLRNQPIQFDDTKSLDSLENTLVLQIAEQKSVLAALTDKQEEQTNLSLRAKQIAQKVEQARADKAQIETALASQSANNLSLVEQASYLKKQANIKKLSATIDALQREIATIPNRQSLVEAELVQLRTKSEYNENIIQKLQSKIAKTRNNQAQETLEQSEQTLVSLKQQPALSAIASENLLLAKLLKDLRNNPVINDTSISVLRSQLVDVNQSSQTVERVLATGRVSDELGDLLRTLRNRLPNESIIEKRKTAIEEEAVRKQLNVILWQEQLRNTVNISSTAERLLQANQDDQTFSQQKLQSASDLVRSRRNLLQALVEESNVQSDRIVEEKLIINQLLAASSQLRELLDRRLIWLPSNSGVAGNFTANLQNSLEWYLLPNAWLRLTRDLYKGALASPVLPILLLVIPLLILFLRLRIKRKLWSLVDQVGKVTRDTYLTTPLALALTFILALPLPVFLFLIAGMIFKGADATGFSNAIATGLASVSTLSLILLFFRSMCRKGGLFEEHFGWSDTAREKLQHMLTWFVWTQSIASFLFASAIASGESYLRYGIAIVAFIIGSLAITVFSYLFFQPKHGVAPNIVGDNSAGILTLITFPIVVVAPLAIGSLPLFGFFDTAVLLQSKLFFSGVLLVFAAVFYGILLRFFLVAFRRYMARKKQLAANLAASKAQQLKDKTVSETNAEAIAAIDQEKEIDGDEVTRQSSSIIMWLTGLLLFVGLWMVWRTLLPALGIVEDIVLWQQVKIVDGVELSSDVTLWNIILSILFVAGGVVAAQNIRGVMEIGLFERLQMDNGARYATVTILGYLLVGTGVVVGFSYLGIEWSKLQWIVAALGVGLGFGLQEIVANFVSGLIILFERPIRVGDFVTIGNQSGTVTNIKIRATTVTDFDNREVLLPNKSIITENVTNWTLHDAVTRIVVKIGVAYGSDIDKVRDLLMQVLKNRDEVLVHPPAQVFFLEHGDSSLNFELRAFVSRPEERLPLTHAINAEVNKTLAEHGISIPFPQRDLHIISGQIVNKEDSPGSN